jgi:hypothetical protein
MDIAEESQPQRNVGRGTRRCPAIHAHLSGKGSGKPAPLTALAAHDRCGGHGPDGLTGPAATAAATDTKGGRQQTCDRPGQTATRPPVPGSSPGCLRLRGIRLATWALRSRSSRIVTWV